MKQTVDQLKIWLSCAVVLSVVIAIYCFNQQHKINKLQDANSALQQDNDDLNQQVNDLGHTIDEANSNIDDANSEISDAQGYSGSSYDDMQSALDNLTTVDNVNH